MRFATLGCAALVLILLSAVSLAAQHPFELANGQQEASVTLGRSLEHATVSGYAEVIETRLDQNDFHMHFRVWFDENHNYRVEDNAAFTVGSRKADRLWTCAIKLGTHFYCGLEDERKQVDWYACPATWMPRYVDTYLGKTRKLYDAKLVGKEKLLGLDVLHWRGRMRCERDSNIGDVWVSTDARFPLIVRYQTTWGGYTTTWKVSRLNLLRASPGYMFTAQTIPRPGILSLLNAVYKPMPQLLIWLALLLGFSTGLAFSLQSGEAKNAIRSRALCVLCACGLMGLLRIFPKLDVYFYQLTDLPVLAGLAALMFTAFAFIWRAVGRPAGVAIFKGTRWPVALLSLLAVFVALILSSGSRQAFLSNLSILGNLSSLTILLNIALCLAPWMAFEELVFRGYVFAALQRRFPSVVITIAAQAAIFALYHIPRLYGNDLRHMGIDAVALTAFGVLFGLLRWRYKNLGAPWLVHLTYDIVVTYVAYANTHAYLQWFQVATF